MRELTIAHSQDCDDAFMFYALLNEKIPTDGLTFKSLTSDIETLNKLAQDAVYDITALSLHAYAYCFKNYRILGSGASVSDNYGPIVVAREPYISSMLTDKIIAIPGLKTTAYLLLNLMLEGKLKYMIMPYNEIMAAVTMGSVDAGVLIHECQLTYTDHKLKKLIDLGEWWAQETGLPCVLGVVAIKKSIEPSLASKVNECIKKSISYALANQVEALEYAIKFARGLDKETAKRFILMYVNEYSLDMGENARKAATQMLGLAHERRLINIPCILEFV